MGTDIEIRQKRKDALERIRRRSAYIAYSKNSIVLLLDISASMYGKKIKDAKEALVHFLKSINLTENEVGLVAFGERIRMSKMSQDHIHLETKINSFGADGGTPIRNAIKTAYEDILKEKTSPVMVIATDGQPTDSSEEELLEYAIPIKRRGVRIITIGIGEDVNDKFLKRLASSREDYHFAKASFELKKIYEKVAEALALPEKRTNSLRFP